MPDMSAPGLAVGLGGLGVTLRDLVALYAAIARGGTAVALRDGVDDRRRRREPGAPVLSPGAAWYVADILAGVPPPVNGSPGRIAYKTGTSYGYRDAWAIGFDGAHVVGVWVGRPDGTPVAGPVRRRHARRRSCSRRSTASGRSGRRSAAARPTPSSPRPPRCRRRSAISASRASRRSSTATSRRSPIRRTASRSISASAPAIPSPLVIKVRNGAPPFTFFVNGAPIARAPFARSETWQPDGPGFVTLSVVDADGRSDRVTVFVE